eukprot:symbB.v1.2.027847.t3/scaffold2885.1/size67989/5
MTSTIGRLFLQIVNHEEMLTRLAGQAGSRRGPSVFCRPPLGFEGDGDNEVCEEPSPQQKQEADTSKDEAATSEVLDPSVRSEAAALGRAEKRKGKPSFGFESLTTIVPLHPEQENWSPDLWAQAQVLPGEPSDGLIACSVDEFLLMQMECREGVETGCDAKNSETFGTDSSAKQALEEFCEEEMEKTSDVSEEDAASRWSWVPRLRAGSWADESEACMDDTFTRVERADSSGDVTDDKWQAEAKAAEEFDKDEVVVNTGPVEVATHPPPALEEGVHIQTPELQVEDPQPKPAEEARVENRSSDDALMKTLYAIKLQCEMCWTCVSFLIGRLGRIFVSMSSSTSCTSLRSTRSHPLGRSDDNQKDEKHQDDLAVEDAPSGQRRAWRGRAGNPVPAVEETSENQAAENGSLAYNNLLQEPWADLRKKAIHLNRNQYVDFLHERLLAERSYGFRAFKVNAVFGVNQPTCAVSTPDAYTAAINSRGAINSRPRKILAKGLQVRLAIATIRRSVVILRGMRVTGLSRLVENYARKSCRAFPLEELYRFGRGNSERLHLAQLIHQEMAPTSPPEADLTGQCRCAANHERSPLGRILRNFDVRSAMGDARFEEIRSEVDFIFDRFFIKRIGLRFLIQHPGLGMLHHIEAAEAAESALLPGASGIIRSVAVGEILRAAAQEARSAVQEEFGLAPQVEVIGDGAEIPLVHANTFDSMLALTNGSPKAEAVETLSLSRRGTGSKSASKLQRSKSNLTVVSEDQALPLADEAEDDASFFPEDSQEDYCARWAALKPIRDRSASKKGLPRETNSVSIGRLGA